MDLPSICHNDFDDTEGSMLDFVRGLRDESLGSSKEIPATPDFEQEFERCSTNDGSFSLISSEKN